MLSLIVRNTVHRVLLFVIHVTVNWRKMSQKWTFHIRVDNVYHFMLYIIYVAIDMVQELVKLAGYCYRLFIYTYSYTWYNLIYRLHILTSHARDTLHKRVLSFESFFVVMIFRYSIVQASAMHQSTPTLNASSFLSLYRAFF